MAAQIGLAAAATARSCRCATPHCYAAADLERGGGLEIELAEQAHGCAVVLERALRPGWRPFLSPGVARSAAPAEVICHALENGLDVADGIGRVVR